MSDLQLTFLFIGLVLFLGIAAYSWSISNQKSGSNQRRSRASARSSQSDFSNDLLTEPDLKVEDEPNRVPGEVAEPKRATARTASRAPSKSKPRRASAQSNNESDHDDVLGLSELDVEPNLLTRVAAKRGLAAKLSELTRRSRKPSIDLGLNGLESDDVGARVSQVSTNPSSKQGGGVSDPQDVEKYIARRSEVNGTVSSNAAPVDEPLEKPVGADTEAGIVTDLVARITIKSPLEQQELMVLLREYDYKFHRTIKLYGLNQLTDIWCDVEQEQPSALFVDLGLSIQLADRNGAMSSKEAHDFQQMVLAFTTRYDAPFEFSMDVDAALEQAQKLDRIGVQFDSMAVLNIVPRSREGFRVADVESCARDLIMLPDTQGVFVKTTGQRNNLSVMYRLACSDGEGSHGITHVKGGHIFDLVFLMNVPATQNPEQVFQEMIDDANKLAVWLEGKVVDRSGRGLTQRSLNTLLTQVSQISAGLRSMGITPGDAVSKKLF